MRFTIGPLTDLQNKQRKLKRTMSNTQSNDFAVATQLLEPSNWSFCHFASSNKKAKISIGADPNCDDIYYYANILDEKDKALFQRKFASLELACQYINQNYNDWPFVNELVAKDDGGCSTCSAH